MIAFLLLFLHLFAEVVVWKRLRSLFFYRFALRTHITLAHPSAGSSGIFQPNFVFQFMDWSSRTKLRIARKLSNMPDWHHLPNVQLRTKFAEKRMASHFPMIILSGISGSRGCEGVTVCSTSWYDHWRKFCEVFNCSGFSRHIFFISWVSPASSIPERMVYASLRCRLLLKCNSSQCALSCSRMEV